MRVPVYDVKNCGPRHRFVANGKLVHNSDAINLQNLPRGSALKKTIMAPDGYAFIDCDSSQIEARTLAWLAGQHDAVEVFRKNNEEIAAGVPKQEMKYDPYKIMASRIWGVNGYDVTERQRFIGKTTVLGCGYGLGPESLFRQLVEMGVPDFTLQDCEHVISVYRKAYPQIVTLWNNADRALTAMMHQRTSPIGPTGAVTVNLMGVRLPNGLYLRYPNLRTETNFINLKAGVTHRVYDLKKGRSVIPTKIYGGKCIENICQALARIIIGEQMLEIAKRLRVVMTVHDAVGSLTPLDKVVENRNYVERCMRKSPDWAEGLPLNCESKVGASYGG